MNAPPPIPGMIYKIYILNGTQHVKTCPCGLLPGKLEYWNFAQSKLGFQTFQNNKGADQRRL